MALRIQNERLSGTYLPSVREYSATFGIDRRTLAFAKEDAIVMHPGPMNRGVEIASDIADGPQSVIEQQVEMAMEALGCPPKDADVTKLAGGNALQFFRRVMA